jgi:hypothetical protein
VKRLLMLPLPAALSSCRSAAPLLYCSLPQLRTTDTGCRIGLEPVDKIRCLQIVDFVH